MKTPRLSHCIMLLVAATLLLAVAQYHCDSKIAARQQTVAQAMER